MIGNIHTVVHGSQRNFFQLGSYMSGRCTSKFETQSTIESNEEFTMKKFFAALSLSLLQITNAVAIEIDSLNWELKKEKDGIKVMTAAVPQSSHRAYMAVTVVDASTTDLVNIIRDPATRTEWVYRCGESYRYDQEAPNVDLVYTASDMPFPVQDRDTLARITWNQDPETKVVKAVGVATNDILAPKKKHVRIEDATVIWELTPLQDGSTQVRTFGHADPGGELPVWLTNQLSTEVPVITLNGLKKLVAENRAHVVKDLGYTASRF